MNERTDQKKSVADMMQDRCNGFSGQALHHLNASEACQPCYTARESLGGCECFAFSQCGVRWAKEGDAIGAMEILKTAVSPSKMRQR